MKPGQLHRFVTPYPRSGPRIIVLAAIPVVGFLVNGIAFTRRERERRERVSDGWSIPSNLAGSQP